MDFQSIVIPVRYHNKFPKFVHNMIDFNMHYLGLHYIYIFENCPEFPFITKFQKINFAFYIFSVWSFQHTKFSQDMYYILYLWLYLPFTIF